MLTLEQLNPSQRIREDLDRPYEKESLGALLLDFLVYYGSDFPYSTSFISVKECKLIPKDGQEWIGDKYPDNLVVQCLMNPGE